MLATKTGSVTAALIFLVFTVFSANGQETEASAVTGVWFRSDALGQQYQEVPWFDRKRYEWMVKKSRSGREETLTLFHKGELEKVWLRELNEKGDAKRVVTIVQGETVAEASYDANGKIIHEIEFRANVPIYEFVYTYNASGLHQRIVKNSEGVELFRDTIFRMPDGRMRRVERDGPEGALAEVGWIYGAQGKIQEWVRDEDLKKLKRARAYDYKSDSVSESLLEDSKVILQKTTDLTKKGTSVERVESSDLKTQILRFTDTKGRVVEEKILSGDEVLSDRTWAYDDQNRILREETVVDGVRDVLTHDYSVADRELLELRHSGTLVSREYWVKGNKQKLEVFDQGQMILEELWEDGEKVRENYYKGNVLIRTRVLKKAAETKP